MCMLRASSATLHCQATQYLPLNSPCIAFHLNLISSTEKLYEEVQFPAAAMESKEDGSTNSIHSGAGGRIGTFFNMQHVHTDLSYRVSRAKNGVSTFTSENTGRRFRRRTTTFRHALLPTNQRAVETESRDVYQCLSKKTGNSNEEITLTVEPKTPNLVRDVDDKPQFRWVYVIANSLTGPVETIGLIHFQALSVQFAYESEGIQGNCNCRNAD